MTEKGGFVVCRVNKHESDSIYKALKAKGQEVEYYVYPDEGHGFVRPENNRDFNQRVDNFLAQCLGGRAEPLQPVPGASTQVVSGPGDTGTAQPAAVTKAALVPTPGVASANTAPKSIG